MDTMNEKPDKCQQDEEANWKKYGLLNDKSGDEIFWEMMEYAGRGVVRLVKSLFGNWTTPKQ